MSIESSLYLRYPMMGEAFHRHSFSSHLDTLSRFPATFLPSNYFYMAFCIIVFIYTLHKREKKLTQCASHFMEILSLTQTIIILEINFHKRVVKSTNPLISNKYKQATTPSNESYIENVIYIEEFCQSHEIDPIILHNTIATHMNPNTSCDVQLKSKGSVSYRVSGKYNPNTGIFQGIILDNSQEKRQLKKLKNTLTHDPLTGLQNRYRLNNKIEKFCSKSSSDLCSLYFIDLNRFKQINDTYGHDNGDVVLKEVSERFLQYADESVLPVRLSGDEFLIVKRNIESTEQANQFIDTFLTSVSSEQVQLSNEINISVSLSFGGVVFTKSQSTSTEKLIKCADERMYQMKKNGNSLPKEQIIVNFLDH